ncbi:MAG: class I SAM-dependent methyltransferase [Verrucomicrobiota bacterium]
MFGIGGKAVKQWFAEDGQMFIEQLGVSPGHKILDFGCGVGSVTVPAASVVGPEGTVFALDVKQGQLDTIRRKISGSEEEARVRLIKTPGGPEFPGVDDRALDAVFVFDVLQHLQDWQGLFRECGRTLKESGRLHINASELSHKGRVDVQHMQELLNEAGFRETGSIRTRLMHYKHMTEDIVRSYANGPAILIMASSAQNLFV